MKRGRGSILVVVLFALGVLSLVATSFAYRASLEGRCARRRAVVVRLKAQASSAVAIALGRLSENVNDYDHPAEDWCAHGALAREDWLESWCAKEDGEGSEYVADYQVVDESGKLNVNYASGVSLRKLGMSKVQVSSLFDWMDRDGGVEADGAENEYYASRPRPYRCKNGPLEVLDELLLIRGFGVWDYLGEDANHNRGCEWNENDGSESYPPDDKDGRVRMGYVDLLTCIGDGRINLNTVPGAVLRALPLSEGGVRQIEEYLSYRDGRGGSMEEHVFRSEADIEQLQGLTVADREVLKGMALFRSRHFRVFSQAVHVPTGLAWRVEALVRMEDQQARVMQWKGGE